MFRHNVTFWCLPLLFVLAACQSTPPQPGMKLGKPYEVDGKTYYPEYNPSYDKVGDASWYGPGFDGKYTASGEIFDQDDLTAAHPTLPMPSMVRVTNLNNGKSLIVRVNDRGPFKSNRIIDLSKGSAKQLGVTSLAKVRVQYLKEQTEAYLQNSDHRIDMARYNRDAEHVQEQQVAKAEPAEASESVETAEIAPPQENQQIVENLDASSHAGQMINDAAPIMTVNADEIAQPKPAPVKTSKASLIRDAVADDNVLPASSKIASKQTALDDMTYIVQAGAFSTEANARKLGAKLSDSGSLFIDKMDAGKKIWWRVRLGPFKDHEQADDALARVRAAGVPDARIIHL